MRIFDRAAQIVTTSGTDRFVVLGPALPNMQTFLESASGVSDVFQFHYLLLDGEGSGWEQGIGEITTDIGDGDPFDRKTVIRSSASNARIALNETNGGLLYCVPFAVSSVLATASVDVANPSAGPSVTDDASGALAAGHNALANASNSTALGSNAQARAGGDTALGSRAVNYVPGAIASSDGKSSTARGHAVDWSASNTSTGTTSVAVTNNNAGGNFEPAENSAYVMEVQVVGRRTAPSAGVYGATIHALVSRIGTSAPTIAGQAKTDTAGGLAGNCSLSVVGNAIQLNANGAASGETWYWAATVRATEQRGA
jgi:hypothetical protein